MRSRDLAARSCRHLTGILHSARATLDCLASSHCHRSCLLGLGLLSTGLAMTRVLLLSFVLSVLVSGHAATADIPLECRPPPAIFGEPAEPCPSVVLCVPTPEEPWCAYDSAAAYHEAQASLPRRCWQAEAERRRRCAPYARPMPPSLAQDLEDRVDDLENRPEPLGRTRWP